MSADLFADWQQEQKQASSREKKRDQKGSDAGQSHEYGYGDEGDDRLDDDFEEFGAANKSMFELKEHHLKMSRRKGFTLKSMDVGNGIMALASHEGSVLRCTIQAKENNVEEIPIEPKIPVYNVFLDPSGGHMIISMENGNNYYIHTSSN